MANLEVNYILTSNANTSPEYISDTLRYIAVHRIEVFIDITLQGRTINQVRGFCADYNKKFVRFYIHSVEDFSVPEGAEVSAFYYIFAKNKRIPCNFIAPVEKVFQHKGFYFLDTIFPKTIGHTQRRNCVRTPVTKKEIPHLKLWLEDKISENQNAQWVEVANNYFEIIDISAGGMLFIINEKCPMAATIKENSQVLCSGTFLFGKKPPINLSMLGTVRRYAPSSSSGWNSMGIRFTRWAFLESHSKWNLISDDNGVPALANWVFQLMANRKRAQD